MNKERRAIKLIVAALMVVCLVGGTAVPVDAATKKPSKVKISKVKSNAVACETVYWKRAKRAKGYQVQIGTNKKCTSSKKVVRVSSKKRNVTFKKLKQGKRYYAKVRAYTTVKKKVRGKKKTVRVYGKWSSVKSAVTKKETSAAKNPTKPTSPTKPTNPTKPTKPVAPTNPTSPTNPTNPTTPTTPTEPAVEYPDWKTIPEDVYRDQYPTFFPKHELYTENECVTNHNGHHYIVKEVTSGNQYEKMLHKGGLYANKGQVSTLVTPNNDTTSYQSLLVKELYLNGDITREASSAFSNWWSITDVPCSFTIVEDNDQPYTVTYHCALCGHEETKVVSGCKHHWTYSSNGVIEAEGYVKYCVNCGVYSKGDL